MKLKERILEYVAQKGMIEPHVADSGLEEMFGIEYAESSIRSACLQLSKDGVLKKTKIWNGRDYRYKRAGYYTAYKLSDTPPN